MEPRRARIDTRLRARIVSRQALRYSSHDAHHDHGPHVRAASGITWWNDHLLIIQDDALYIAQVDERTGTCEAIALPPGHEGARLFDVERGNKQHKLDLETCTAVDRAGVSTLLALGSGSSAAREQIVCVHADRGSYVTRVIAAHRLYAALRDHPQFATSELNLEGVVALGDRLRLFQRSNGLARAATKACATCDLDWSEFDAFLSAPDSAPVPMIHDVRQYDLGHVAGVALTFTDATVWRAGRLLFLASAEGSPNAIDDGAVVGTAVGLIDDNGETRLCLLRDEHGHPVTDKAEGIALARSRPNQAYVVFDPDDHRAPATLALVALEGF